MIFKNIKFLIAACLLIIAASFIFYNPIQLTDILSSQTPQGFFIKWHDIRYWIEPLYAFVFYGLTLERAFYKPVLISWGAWTVVLIFIYCAYKQTDFSKWLIKTFYALLSLCVLFIFCALAPIPGPKLIKPQGYTAIDIHSHSRYSHDNVSTEKLNIKFHKWAGYDSYFISEHNNTDSFNLFPENLKFTTIFPAVQMQSSQGGISLVLLSPKEFDGAEFRNLTIKEMIIKAHNNNMLAIMPHWWKWGRFSFEDLKNMGIDGFEIYNFGYKNFDEAARQELIDFAEKNNLLTFASTDWHGWGYMTDAWTIIKEPVKENGNLVEILSEKPDMMLVLYRQKQSSSIIRFIFEPFCAFYYYIKNADNKMLASFIIWLIALFVFFNLRISKIFLNWLPLFFSALFAVLSLYFLYIYFPARHTNNILLHEMFFYALGFSLLWFIFWRIRNYFYKD